MRVSHRFFVYGIILTSLAWMFALYLYGKLVGVSQGMIENRSYPRKSLIQTLDLGEYQKKVKINNDQAPNDVDWEYPSHRDRKAPIIRHPQLDDERLKRKLDEVDRRKFGTNVLDRSKNRLNFDDYMFNKQQIYANKNHVEKQQLEAVADREKNEVLQRDTGDSLADLGIIRSPQDQKRRDEGERRYAFNVLISDRLSYHRAVPDYRHNSCKAKVYSDNLPTASVVICFHNEAVSTLLRTIHSVIDRTPTHLLHEVILVDDSSDLSDLQDGLQSYIDTEFSKVQLIRNSKREGLIRSRIIGAEKASGGVLVFLDSHCEVNVEWLQPLLSRIHDNSSTVTIPIVDIIDQDTFEYEASPIVRGGFNWGMHFRWDSLPADWYKHHGKSDPITTPTMSGGLFAISRDYFNTMGQYDPGLDIWGGENLEISFRIWQCGGRLEIVPCSRVGHVFRKRRPYSSPGGDAMLRNSLRVANVWMDEYKEHFFHVRPEAEKVQYGNITGRLELRQRLQCRPFKWYLDNVYPEQTLPDKAGRGGFAKGPIPKKDLPNVIRKGHLKHRSSGQCVAAEGGAYNKRALLQLVDCNRMNKEQRWLELEDHSLQLSSSLCLDVEAAGRGEAFPRIMKCHFSGGSQEWRFIGHFQTMLYNPASGKCLGADSSGDSSYLSLELCNDSTQHLHFDLRTNL